MGLQRFPISNPVGGLNTRDNAAELDPTEAQILSNYTLTERGILKKRKGKVRFDTSGFPGVPGADHLRPYYFSAATMRLAASLDGDIFTATQAGALTSRFDGTAGSVWHFETATDSTGANKLWCLNGVDAPQKLDGLMAASAWANSPPAGSMLRLWRNRMVIAGVPGFPARLFYSDIGNPEAPAAAYGANWIDIKSTEDDLDPITWIEILQDKLLVFKRGSVWVVENDATFANRRLGAPGCVGRFMSAVVAGKCFYFSREGVYSVQLGGTLQTGEAPQSESGQIRPFIKDNLNFAAIDKVRVFASRDNRLFVAMPFGSNTFNSHLIEGVLGLKRVSSDSEDSDFPWASHDLRVDSACTFRPINTDVLIAGSTSLGTAHLFTLFAGTSDDGQAIKAYGMTGWRGVITEEPFERLRRVNVVFTGKLYLDVFRDFAEAPVFSGVAEAPVDADPTWDGGTWDGGRWDPVISTALRRFRPDSRARYHAIQWRNEDLNSDLEVFKTEIALRGGKEHT